LLLLLLLVLLPSSSFSGFGILFWSFSRSIRVLKKITSVNNWSGLLTGWMPFQPLDQQHQSTEWNSKHWHQPWKITH